MNPVPLARRSIRLMAALALMLAAGSGYAEDSAETGKDALRVESSEPADYRGTRQDVESNITDELAVKLRQFDEWTAENEEQQAAAAESGSSAAGGSGASNPSGNASAQTAEGGDDGASPTASPTQAAENENTSLAAEEGQALPRSTAQPPARPDRRAKEDDVARMIREAAEQETDPERRKALMEQYDAYLRNR